MHTIGANVRGYVTISREQHGVKHQVTLQLRLDMATGPTYIDSVEREAEMDAANVERILRAIAELARTQPRPSGEHQLCRTLLDIERLARATADDLKGERQ